MPEIKIDIEIDFKKEYDGKNKSIVKDGKFNIKPYKYNKSAKVEEETLTFKEVKKEFLQASEGIVLSIGYLLDGVIEDCKKSGKNDLATIAKKAEKELVPWHRRLDKLLNTVIDELGGNETADEDDGKWQDSTKIFVEKSLDFGDLGSAYEKLLKELEVQRDKAAQLWEKRGEATSSKKWDETCKDVEKQFQDFETEAEKVRKDLKKRAPKIDVPKKPSKESDAQKDLRVAKETLAKSMEKLVKLRQEVATVLGAVDGFRDKIMTPLRAELEKYQPRSWPTPPPKLDDACDIVAKFSKDTQKALDEVLKLDKKK